MAQSKQPSSFHETGAVVDSIPVQITYQIIGLFSEGLYSSPNKAIEELVSNSFDADATHVHVALTPDLGSPTSSIVVLDDGIGMDRHGLKVHWVVGDSPKQNNRKTPSGRNTIGKFGIGKLAAYVLGERLTHISKSGDKYYSTSMDFRSIPQTANVSTVDGPPTSLASPPVILPLRELTETEAKAALEPWLTQPGVGRLDLPLFGPEASETWTAAIISDLKPMAQGLTAGMLRWVLSTGMPLRDDFKLYLNGAPVPASKLSGKRVGTWTLGRELIDLPNPSPSELDASTNPQVPKTDYQHWYVTDSVLGPMTGYLEVYEDPIDAGKSNLRGRSNGFFVYVHGRLINPDDAGFGIDRNKLRHGTFSRFRFVVNIDRLDEELRSSRETLRAGPRLVRSREFLQGVFNFARNKLDAHHLQVSPERQVRDRLAESPASLSERPILRLAIDAFDGVVQTRHLTVVDRSAFNTSDELRAHIEQRVADGQGVVANVQFADLGLTQPIAVLDYGTGNLSINLEHPFVAHFADQFGDRKRNLPLQLFAVSEIILEAQLHSSGIGQDVVFEILDDRDELLRNLARSSGAKNSLTVAQDLLAAASSKKGLEQAVVEAFAQLGFQAVPKGANNDPDGLAEAFLPADAGVAGHYRVSLEAKSKETVGAKVKKKDVEVATIARHRDDNKCDFAIVIGPAFETGTQDSGALIQEIDADRKNNPGKSITLMTIADLARLVRLAPLKRLNLQQIRELFKCRSPSESATWVDEQTAISTNPGPYKVIIETVWSEQQIDKGESVTYGALRVALRHKGLTITDQDLRTECLALSRIAPGYFVERGDRVELNIHPDRVLESIHEYLESIKASE